MRPRTMSFDLPALPDTDAILYTFTNYPAYQPTSEQRAGGLDEVSLNP